VTRARCRAYAAARRAEGVGDGTIYTELTYLRAALRHANATGWAVELPRKPPPRDHRLTREQYAALLDACSGTPHLRLFVVLALATAGRAEAILSLTWDRVDFDRGLIDLGAGERRRKGRAIVPMTDRARAALLEASQARTTQWVIEWAGKRVAKLRTSFGRAARAAGVPWCTPHVLRHTAASWMAEAGVPMAAIAQFLGHEDARITERVYARFSPTYLRDAARALD
jgi:integrase